MADPMKLLPVSLAELISQSGREFLIRYTDAMFLVVDVGDERTMLATALSTLSSGAVSVLAFNTAVSAHDANYDERRSVADVQHMLVHGPCFGIVLGKRGRDKVYPDRVSVGRALNKDVVLRHHSVSKFHAWFERDHERWLLADAGSTNRTHVNGVALTAKQALHVGTGDVIRFGSITCVLCSPRLLQQALSPLA